MTANAQAHNPIKMMSGQAFANSVTFGSYYIRVEHNVHEGFFILCTIVHHVIIVQIDSRFIVLTSKTHFVYVEGGNMTGDPFIDFLVGFTTKSVQQPLILTCRGPVMALIDHNYYYYYLDLQDRK